MHSISAKFFISSIVYGAIGMLWGTSMAIQSDHAMMPAHAHLMVLGWLSFAIFGLFYRLFPQEAERRLATIHLWSAQAGMILLVAGIALAVTEQAVGPTLAAMGSVLSIASFVMFGLVAVRGWR